jgi:hypothetical protein
MRPTQQLLNGKYRHLRLTTKDINKGYYKGNRTGTIGTHTKHGGFIVDYSRVRTYVVPQGLKDFKVCRVLGSLERIAYMNHSTDQWELAAHTVCDSELGQDIWTVRDQGWSTRPGAVSQQVEARECGGLSGGIMDWIDNGWIAVERHQLAKKGTKLNSHAIA